jgi:hypothetical protein
MQQIQKFTLVQNFALFSSKSNDEENEYGVSISTAQQPTATIIKRLPYARICGDRLIVLTLMACPLT